MAVELIAGKGEIVALGIDTGEKPVLYRNSTIVDKKFFAFVGQLPGMRVLQVNVGAWDFVAEDRWITLGYLEKWLVGMETEVRVTHWCYGDNVEGWGWSSRLHPGR